MRSFLLLFALATSTLGCIIVPRHHHLHPGRPHVVRPVCPPGTSWDGYGCRPHHHHHHRR
ncbi:MAG: hypothetical protein ACOZQL_34835 [Myxococcota bacterium]